MLEIADLIFKGVTGLVRFIPLWAGAKTPEEQAAIKAKAVELVGGLDAYFAVHDAADKDKQDELQAKIDRQKEATQP